MTEDALPPPRPSYAPRTVRLLHSGMTVGRYHAMHFLCALLPVAAGVTFFGWRAAAAVGGVVGAAALAFAFWRNVGARGRQLELSHTLWLALLLGLMLPAHLASALPLQPGAGPGWPVLAVAGVGLVVVLWVAGGLGAGHVHPAVVTYLLLAVAFRAYLVPYWALAKEHAAAGDVLNAAPAADEFDPLSPDPWLRRDPPDGHWQATKTMPAAVQLTAYTTGRLRPDRGQMPMVEFVRDRMPPPEDLIVGGQPAPVGLGSGVAVIVGGLFLMYRGLIDFRIPLLACLCAFVALAVLPVPTAVRDAGPHWRWLAWREPGVGWETAFAFVSYELMAGPLLFVAFFLATNPALRPLSRRARALYAGVLGLLCGVGQLYVSASLGPYLALLVAGVLAAVFDRWFRPRPLV